jgi:F420-non-reducing hydrogenase small subunit
MGARKLQIALYWGSACGGCDVAVLDTNGFVLELASLADIRLWPLAVDAKYSAVRGMADGELDVALYSGAVRNSENAELARLLRAKSKLLVALGSCAHLGGIPGLANLCSRGEILLEVYGRSRTLEPGRRSVPATRTRVAAGELELPEFSARVWSLDQVVDVDYTVPGCPPAPEQVESVLRALVAGALPPAGSVVGASTRSLCEQCRRETSDKKARRFWRPHEVLQDPARCLLEQGIVCAGPATRGGCGVRCPDSGMPCRGCYGPLPGVKDQGARLLSAVASVVDSRDPEEIDRILDGIPDFAGLAYRFGLPASIVQRRQGP